MEFKNITTWSVSKGIATPKSPFNDVKDYSYRKFEDFAQQHTYATDAPDGSYSADKFAEPLIQFKHIHDDEWINAKQGVFKSYSDFKIELESTNKSLNTHFESRYFLPFIDQVKEAEIITLDINDFSISIQDIERAFCYGYLANPESDCLDSAEMIRRYELFKTNYLTPMLSRKGIID